MDHFKRYAIYHAPNGALMQAGSAWLGWDAETGQTCPHPDPGALPHPLPRPLAEITATPRKYGFHATIKAPFRLREGRNGDDLAEAMGALAGQLAPVTLDGMAAAELGRFVALRPTGATDPLQAMAATVVERLDMFRAPMGAEEMARRAPDTLSERQRALLVQFGYPYVLEQFHMHMTLSGSLPGPEREQVRAVARSHFAALLPSPYILDQLCLFGEAQDGRFHILHRYTLTG